MKKILICCDYMAPYEGNFISSIKALDECLKEKYDITYLFPKGQNTDFLIWFNKFCETRNVLTYNPFDYAFIENEFSKDFDLIYLHFFSIGFAKKLCLNNPEKKVILHGHHKPILKKWRAIVEYIKSFNTRFNNLYVISCSPGVYKDYRLMAKRSNVFLSPNCIDFNRIDYLSNVACKTKKTDDIIISMFGGELYTKGVDIACRAINKLKMKEIKLNVYCSHNLERNKKQIDGCYLDCNVNFLKYRTNPCDVYLNTDLFIAPSRFEGFNYSILECSYCGTPVVASNLPEHKHKDCNYVFFRNKSFRSLSKAITKALTIGCKPADKQLMRRNYDISNWVTNIITIFNTILGF